MLDLLDTDECSLKKYSGQITTKYIEQKLVFFPNLLTKAETFIIVPEGIFDDSIIHNAMSMNKLPPLSMASLRIAKTT